MKISDLVNFSIQKNYVEAGNLKVYFLRYEPPNLNIMTLAEKATEIQRFQELYDSLSDTRCQTFSLDKTENLRGNRDFWSSLLQEDDSGDKGAEIKHTVIDQIDSIESTSSSVGRAFYFVLKVKDPAELSNFETALNARSINYYIAEKQELVTALRNYLLREFVGFDIMAFEQETDAAFESQKGKKVPDKGTFFRSELARRMAPQRMMFGVRNIEQNDFYRRVLMIKNFPSVLVASCALSTLAQMKGTTFSMHVSPMQGAQGKRLIDNQLRNITAKGHKKEATEQIEAGVERETIVNFYTDLQRRNSRIYNVNIFIECYGKTVKDLEDKVGEVISNLSGYGITVEHLSYEQREGFLSVYPLGEDKFKASANNMPSGTLASLYPYSYSSKNDVNGLPLGKTLDGGNIFIDFWVRNQLLTNGNFTIIGESGQGKSYLKKKILSMSAATGVSCSTIDPEGEYNDLYRNLGGTVIDVSSGRVKINPFEIRSLKTDDDDTEDSADVEAFNCKAAFYQHLSWLKDFTKILIPPIGDKEIAAAMILTKDMYMFRRGITEKTDIQRIKPEDYPTYTDFYEYVNDAFLDGAEKYPMISKDMLRGLLLLFKDVYDGSLGFLFNGTTNIVNHDLVNYDISGLLQGSKERTEAELFNIMTYTWNRISQRLKRTLFSVDELYLLVNRNNFTMANYMKEFIKRVRKYDSMIGSATQNLGDFLDPLIEHITSPLFNNPTYKFIFYPSDLDLNKVKNLLRLTDGEVDCIKTPHKGRCLFKCGGDKYVMQVGTLPYEAKLFGAAGGR